MKRDLRIGFTILGLAVSIGASASAAEFQRLQTHAGVSGLTMTDDCRTTIVTHQAENLVSIVETQSGKVVKELETTAPAFVLARGSQLIVANDGKGTLSIFDQAKDWALVKRIDLRSPRPVYLTAGQGKYFNSFVIVLCQTELQYEKDILLVDTRRGQVRQFRPREMISAMTLDYTASYVIWQSTPGSPSRRIGGATDFRAEMQGGKVESLPPGWDTMPIVHQVRDNKFWFGGNRICYGLPPKSLGEGRGVMVVPDRLADGCYVIDRHQIECIALNTELQTIGRQIATFPTDYERMHEVGPYISPRETEGFDFHHCAASIDGSLYVCLFGQREQCIYWCKTEAFDIPSQPSVGFGSVVASTPNRSPRRGNPTPMPTQPIGPLNKPVTPSERAASDTAIHELADESFSLSYGVDGESILLVNGDRLLVLDGSGLRKLKTHQLESPYLQIAEREEYYVALATDRVDLLRKDNADVFRSVSIRATAEQLAIHPGAPICYVAVKPTIGHLENLTQPLLQIEETNADVSELTDVAGNMVAVDPQGRQLYVGNHVIFENAFLNDKYGHRDAITTYSILSLPPRKTAENKQPGTNGKRIVLSPDGKHLAYVAGGGAAGGRPYAVASFSTDDVTKETARYQLEPFPEGFAYHPSANLVAGINGRKLWVFERDSGRLASERFEPREFQGLRGVLFSAAGSNLLVAHRLPSRGAVIEVVPLQLSASERAKFAKAFPKFKPRAPIDLDAAAAARVWVDASGTYKVKATFVEFADGKVKLKRSDGSDIAVPLERLSKADQDLVAVLVASRPPPATKLPDLPPANIPSGWVRFISETGDFSVAAPGDMIKDPTSNTPHYQYHGVGRPTYNLEVFEIGNPSASIEQQLARGVKASVGVHDGKMIEEAAFKAAGVPARRFVYQIEIADEQQLYYQCNFLLNGQIIELTVTDEAADFAPADLRDVEQYFGSFRPLKTTP